MNSPPLLLLAFANDRDDRVNYLRNLPEELRRITESLDRAKAEGLCDYVYLANATLKQILDTFQKAEYRNRIAVFHYGGHANSLQWLLETAEGRAEAIDVAGLAAFLGQQRGLQLIFLNGCSTQKQVEAFEATVPMVIATSQAIDDQVAMEFANRFYRGLASGAHVQSAYKEAESAVRSAGNGTVRHLYWAGAQQALAEIQEERWPWELHFKKGAEAEGHWNLPETVGNPLFGVPSVPLGDLPYEPFRHLAWFAREHAEIFFGRNYQIRQLYNRLTEPNAAPIILLYGQAGVGKSSLLDAGLTPRLQATHEVIYLRRNQDLGLLQTAIQGISLPKEPGSLSSAWRQREAQNGRPLALILDQVEEVFTRPSGDTQLELQHFLEALEETFASLQARPQGRLILGFRKEWESEIEEQLKEHKLPHAKVFLNALSRREIIQAISGLTQSPRLQQHYGLVIKDDLPELIAGDLSSDPNSPIAPTLQILLTKLWAVAKKRNNTRPTFNEDLYLELQKQGILLGDFLDQQLAKLQSQPEVLNSGLVLDVLAFHTTPLGTAEQRTESEVQQEYRHLFAVLPRLLEKLKELYLLADPPQDYLDSVTTKATRLAHDTLGPLIRAKFNHSVHPGQRARRILENRRVEWADNQTGSPLDTRDLMSVEAGRSGMRATLPEEDRLIEASKRTSARRELRRKALRVVATIAVIAVVTSAGVAWWLRGRAEAARQQAVSGQLAAQANSLARGPARLLTQRVLLGIEALRRSESAASDAALREPLALLPALRAVRRNPHAKVVNSSPEDKVTPAEGAAWTSSVQFSPDNRTVAILEGNKVSLWDFTTNGIVGEFKDEEHIRVIRFSHDGRYVVTGSGTIKAVRSKGKRVSEIHSTKGAVIVWDCLEHRQIAKREFPTMVRNVGFLKDGPFITVAELKTATTMFLDGREEKASWSIDGPNNNRPIQTALTDDGRYLAAGTTASVKIYDVLSGQIVSAVQVSLPDKGKTYVSQLTFSPDGSRLLTNATELATGKVAAPAFARELAELWDWRAARQISKINLDSERNNFEISSDNKFIAGLSSDQELSIWESASGTAIGQPINKSEQFSGSYYPLIRFSPIAQSVAVSSGDRTVRIFRLSGKEGLAKEFSRIAPGSNITDIAYSADGHYLATGDENGQTAVWELTGFLDSDKINGVEEIDYDPKGQYVVTRTENYLRVSRLDDNREVVRFAGVTSRVMISNNGERFAFVRQADEDRYSLEVCEMASGKILRNVQVPSSETIYAFSDDGKRLLITAEGEPLKELELQSGDVIKHDKIVTSSSVTFSREAKYIAIIADDPDEALESPGDSDNSVRRPRPVDVFDIAREQKVATIVSNAFSSEVVFSTNSDYVATNIDDSTLLIWDLKNSRELRRFKAPESIANPVFSRDNQYVAITADPDALVYNVITGELTVLKHDSGFIKTLAFSNDSKSVVTTHGNLMSEASLVEIWKLPDGETASAIGLDGGVSNAFFTPNDQRLVLMGYGNDEDETYTRFLPWKPRDLINEACKRVGRNLTQAEWKQYLVNEPYRQTCDNLPSEP
jgi:WD40 repeat protein